VIGGKIALQHNRFRLRVDLNGKDGRGVIAAVKGIDALHGAGGRHDNVDGQAWAGDLARRTGITFRPQNHLAAGRLQIHFNFGWLRRGLTIGVAQLLKRFGHVLNGEVAHDGRIAIKRLRSGRTEQGHRQRKAGENVFHKIPLEDKSMASRLTCVEALRAAFKLLP